jgi:outer membrane protein
MIAMQMSKTFFNPSQTKLFLSLFLLSVLLANAQTNAEKTVSECIAIALKNNPNLANNKLDDLIYDAEIGEIKADLYPQLKLKGSYQYYFDVPQSLVPSSLLGGSPNTYSYTAFLVPQNISSSMDFSWQLYNPAILSAIKINKLSKEINKTTIKDKTENIVYDISATYLNIQINELQVNLTQSNIKNLTKNLGLTTKLFDQGLVLRSDMDNIKVSLVNLETVLTNQENAVKELYYLLKVLMGMNPYETLKVQPFAEGSKTITNTTEIDTEAYKNRSSFLSLQQAGEIITLEKKSIKAGYLPTLNLIGSFGYAGLDTQFGAFQTYNDRWYPTNFLQLNLEIPLFDGFKKRNQMLKNKYQSEQNENSLKYLKNTLQMEQLNAINTFNSASKEYDFQTENVALANKLYKQKQLEYQNNTASLTDLLNVENTLKSAQTNYLNTIIKLKIAELDLKKASGQLINN